jgi:hypothetical protein
VDIVYVLPGTTAVVYYTNILLFFTIWGTEDFCSSRNAPFNLLVNTLAYIPTLTSTSEEFNGV